MSMVQIVQISKKLLWSHIKEMYQNEWVELTECDWQSDSAYPLRAIVHNHAPDRAELLKRIGKAQQNRSSIIMYVGFSDSVVSFHLAGAAA